MQTMTSPQLDLLHEIAFEILFSLSIKIFLNSFFPLLSSILHVLHIPLVLPFTHLIDCLDGVSVFLVFFHFFSFLFSSAECSEELKLLMEDDADDDYEPPAN